MAIALALVAMGLLLAWAVRSGLPADHPAINPRRSSLWKFTVTIRADASKAIAGFGLAARAARATADAMRRLAIPPDPNPFPRFHLFGRTR